MYWNFNKTYNADIHDHNSVKLLDVIWQTSRNLFYFTFLHINCTYLIKVKVLCTFGLTSQIMVPKSFEDETNIFMNGQQLEAHLLTYAYVIKCDRAGILLTSINIGQTHLRSMFPQFFSFFHHFFAFWTFYSTTFIDW